MANTGNRNRWWISPVIPTIGNLALAVLWGFSAFGGWGLAAFCTDAGGVAGVPDVSGVSGSGDGGGTAAGVVDAACRQGFGTAVAVSSPPAVLAVAIGLAAWSLPRVRRHPDRLGDSLVVAAVVWAIAEGVLFAGGWLAQS